MMKEENQIGIALLLIRTDKNKIKEQKKEKGNSDNGIGNQQWQSQNLSQGSILKTFFLLLKNLKYINRYR